MSSLYSKVTRSQTNRATLERGLTGDVHHLREADKSVQPSEANILV